MAQLIIDIENDLEVQIKTIANSLNLSINKILSRSKVSKIK